MEDPVLMILKHTLALTQADIEAWRSAQRCFPTFDPEEWLRLYTLIALQKSLEGMIAERGPPILSREGGNSP